MKNYQDTETGQLWAFDDGVDPHALNNRNIPTTLSEKVIPQPSPTHVWLDGEWISESEVPEGYEPPISSVPSYNPAWMVFLSPYTFVLPDSEKTWEISTEQINSNSYDADKLSQAVAILPLSNTKCIHALISYDGAIAIPRNADYPSNEKATESINHILCAILLGGIHVEVLYPKDLMCGSLHDEQDVFSNTPSMHSRLRHKWASIPERTPLMHPRILRTSDMQNAYAHGLSVIQAIPNLSPFFLLNGYSALNYQNRSDALSSLWIVVEQLTWFLWKNNFLGTPKSHLKKVKSRYKVLSQRRQLDNISSKHELFNLAGIISDKCFDVLSVARKKRNDLMHEGLVPDFSTIANLWLYLSDLIETASGITSIKMRQLVFFDPPNYGIANRDNFDEWKTLTERLSH